MAGSVLVTGATAKCEGAAGAEPRLPLSGPADTIAS
jgi:hypothetical protein